MYGCERIGPKWALCELSFRERSSLKGCKNTITNLESMLIDTIPCMSILQALAAKRPNKILTSFCLPELEEGKYDSYFPLLSGEENTSLISLCFPEMEEGK